MALFGSIVIGMQTQTKNLAKGFASAGDIVKGFENSILKVGAIAGAAFGVSSVVGFVKGSLEAADAANDMATQIGTTAGKLQSLRYIAKITGSETESLDGSLQKMATNLGDAALQGGPAEKTLARLGLNAKKLAAMDPADAFLQIATAISKVPAATEQASAAVDIFGKAGVNVLNTLRAGPDEIGKLAEEAKKFGLALNATDARHIAEANDAMDKLSFAATGFSNVLAANVAPALTEVLSHVTDLIASVSQGTSTFEIFGTNVSDILSVFTVSVRNAGDFLKIMWLKAQEMTANVVAAVMPLPENFGKIMGWIRENWLDGLIELARLWTTMFLNVLDSAKKFGVAIWDAIQGKGFSFEPTNLFAGFKSTLKELPELTQPVWVSMQDQIDAVGEHMAQQEIKHATDVANAVAKAKGPVKLTEQAEKSHLAGVAELNSKDAYSAVAMFFNGRSNDPQKNIEKNTAEGNKIARDQLSELRKAKPAVEVFSFA